MRGGDSIISLITKLKRGLKKQILTADVDERFISKIIEILLPPL